MPRAAADSRSSAPAGRWASARRFASPAVRAVLRRRLSEFAGLVFCITGLLLLQMYAKGRSMTWPLVGLGLGIPVLLALVLIH